jgi:predicted RNase H-like nuclease (RuvC/YqgF family)
MNHPSSNRRRNKAAAPVPPGDADRSGGMPDQDTIRAAIETALGETLGRALAEIPTKVAGLSAEVTGLSRLVETLAETVNQQAVAMERGGSAVSTQIMEFSKRLGELSEEVGALSREFEADQSARTAEKEGCLAEKRSLDDLLDKLDGRLLRLEAFKGRLILMAAGCGGAVAVVVMSAAGLRFADVIQVILRVLG